MKPSNTGNIRSLLIMSVLLYLHYSVTLLWMAVRYNETILLSLFFFHVVLTPILLSLWVDLELTNLTIRFRKSVSFLLKGISILSIVVYLYLLIILIRDVYEGIWLKLPWQSVALNLYVLLILILVNYMDIIKKKKEFLKEARVYFFSLYRNALSLTILSLLVQIILVIIPDRIVFYFGITSMVLIGLDQITVVSRMFIYHEDYFIIQE